MNGLMIKKQFDKLKAEKRRYYEWLKKHRWVNNPVKCQPYKAGKIVDLPGCKTKYEVQENGERRRLD